MGQARDGIRIVELVSKLEKTCKIRDEREYETGNKVVNEENDEKYRQRKGERRVRKGRGNNRWERKQPRAYKA